MACKRLPGNCPTTLVRLTVGADGRHRSLSAVFMPSFGLVDLELSDQPGDEADRSRHDHDAEHV